MNRPISEYREALARLANGSNVRMSLPPRSDDDDFLISEALDLLERGTIKQLVQAAHQNAIDKGWYEEPRTFGEVIALMHSELSEALEDHRNGRKFTEVWYEHKEKGWSVFQHSDEWKPCGIPSELADTVIRIFDFCGHAGIDLEAAIKEKMAYNATRPRRHGGKVL